MKRTMNYNHTLTIRRKNSDFDSIIALIANIVDEIYSAHSKAIENASNEVLFWYNLRNQRKDLDKLTNTLLTKFNSSSETNRVAIELSLYKLSKKINNLLPVCKQELKEGSVWVMYKLIYREVYKISRIIQETQSTMASALYKDHSEEILSNPDLYKEIEDAWAKCDLD